MHIQEHYTDTGRASDQAFALTALLGFRFAPRIRDALSRHLYLVDEVGEYGPLNTVLFGQVKSKLIIEQWDERDAACGLIDPSWNRLCLIAHAQARGLSSSELSGESTH